MAKQEAMRRKITERQARLRTKTKLTKAHAKAYDRATQEWANHDLILEKISLEASEERVAVLKVTQDGGIFLEKELLAALMVLRSLGACLHCSLALLLV